MKGKSGLLSPLLAWWRNREVARLVGAHARVLDVGCGEASLLRELCRQGRPPASYVGVDRRRECIEKNRAMFPQHQFVVCDLDGQDGPGLDGRFDVVTLVAVIEHLEAPERVLGWAAGLVSPGGRLLVTAPRRGREGFYALGVRLGLFSRLAHEEHREVFPDRAWLERLGAAAGLRLKRYRKFMFGCNQIAVFVPGLGGG